jgi:hypothetical protein
MDSAARYTNEEHSALVHREAFDSIHGTPKGGIHRIGLVFANNPHMPRERRECGGASR